MSGLDDAAVDAACVAYVRAHGAPRDQMRVALRAFVSFPRVATIVELAAFSEAQLIEELARRKNRERAPEPLQFCDDCANFKTNPNASDGYNPCQKGRRMSFYLESDACGPEPVCGFYLAVCPDRRERDATEVRA